MKRFLFGICLCAATAAAADLSGVKSVYVLPMANGLDQFVASRLTALQVFQVVADPTKADAIVTDQIGPSFEARMKELRPAEKPAAKPAPDAEKEKTERQSLVRGDVAMFGETVNKLDNPATGSTWGRGKGNVFIVDPNSCAVLWSMWEKSRGSAAEQLDRTASDIANRLKQDLKKKK